MTYIIYADKKSGCFNHKKLIELINVNYFASEFLLLKIFLLVIISSQSKWNVECVTVHSLLFIYSKLIFIFSKSDEGKLFEDQIKVTRVPMRPIPRRTLSVLLARVIFLGLFIFVALLKTEKYIVASQVKDSLEENAAFLNLKTFQLGSPAVSVF